VQKIVVGAFAMTAAEHGPPHATASEPAAPESEFHIPISAQYAIALLLVAVATFIGYAASSVVPAPALTLVFVLPVVIAGTAMSLGPSITAVVAGVLAFDFFFTQPRLTLRMTEPSEIWSAALLFVTAAIVNTLAWLSRRHANDARQAVAQEEELRSLAHALIEGVSQPEIIRAAATALSHMFAAPVAVISELHGSLRVEASAGGAELSEGEMAAAAYALSTRVHLPARAFPHDHSRYDMWPVASTRGCEYLVAVDFGRPGRERVADAERLIEIVGGYFVAASRRKAIKA
jgi:two-component system sensor histidine kinase KdpD